MVKTETDPRPAPDNGHNDRPRFGIGHVSMPAADIDRLTEFYAGIGMRLVTNVGHMAILELRGGTHLVLGAGQAGTTTLDLIVDDIDETHKILRDAGADASTIQRGDPHDRFTAVDPEGNTLLMYSNHAIGPV
jgi:catechol 2,3-dioxygenase-like lactoylglutathione lyase family enzyme